MSVKINKKVELLRALVLNKKQIEDGYISNLGAIAEGVTDDDIMLIEEFKKIYQLGTRQLSKFIGLFTGLVDKLDEYTVFYYTTVLRNGPFRNLKDGVKVPKRHDMEQDGWRPTPDVMGVQGNLNRSTVQTPICDFANGQIEEVFTNVFKLESSASGSGVIAQNFSVDVITKLPIHVQRNSLLLQNNASKLHGYNMSGSLILDDALRGDLSLFCSATNDNPHGAYCIADTTSWNNTVSVSTAIFDAVKGHLNDTNFKLYRFNKLFNRFDSEKNQFVAKNYIVKRKTQSVKDQVDCVNDIAPINIGKEGYGKLEIEEVTIETDLVGNVFESDDVRKEKLEVYRMFIDGRPLVIPKKVVVNTIEGQLEPRLKGE